MISRSTLKFAMFLAVAAPTAVSTLACGGNEGPKVAKVKPDEMPAGGEWSGVYYSTVYGYLHLIKEGDSVTGAWRTTGGDAWGEMAGEVDGNVMKYQWTQHRIGMVGPSASSSGRGYFVYTEPKQGEAHQIVGEWGLGEDETGRKWEAIKQLNMPPDPKSVRPDEVEGRFQGGGWDSEGGGTPDGEPAPSEPDGKDIDESYFEGSKDDEDD